MNDTYSVSCIIPVINETFSLEQTVRIVEEENGTDILEYIILVSDAFTTAESFNTIATLQQWLGHRVVVHHQHMKYLGGALREAFALAKGTHTVMMSSDLETDPYLVKLFIAMSKAEPGTIITASRWSQEGGFEGYSPVKYFLNAVFQKLFSFLYRTHLTDMTFGYRLFPTHWIQRIRWEELRHPFLFETLLKPLRLGIPVKEIPCRWQARKEGVSQNPFFQNFKYFRTGIRVLFMKRKDILPEE